MDIFILDAVSYWTAIKRWEEEEYFTKQLANEDQTTIESTKKKLSISFNISKSSLLANDIYLPLIIQCQELVQCKNLFLTI